MKAFTKWILGVLSTLFVSIIVIALNRVTDHWLDNSQPAVAQSENNKISHVETLNPITNQSVKASKADSNLPIEIPKSSSNDLTEILKPSEAPSIKVSKPLDTVTSHNVSWCKTGNLATQIKCLDNPKAPFTMSLWLDKPGKNRFKSRKRVKVGYQVDGLKKGKIVHLTLLNISPRGQISILFSESIEAGKTYGNLKRDGKSKHDGKDKRDGKGKHDGKDKRDGKGKHATSVKEIKLKRGREYFKAIATFEPINLETFVENAINGTLSNESWKTVDLTVNVK